jgi:hypothetical protein
VPLRQFELCPAAKLDRLLNPPASEDSLQLGYESAKRRMREKKPGAADAADLRDEQKNGRTWTRTTDLLHVRRVGAKSAGVRRSLKLFVLQAF